MEEEEEEGSAVCFPCVELPLFLHTTGNRARVMYSDYQNEHSYYSIIVWTIRRYLCIKGCLPRLKVVKSSRIGR